MNDNLILTERTIDFTPAQVFQAFQQPKLLAKWWGPNGFSNTFEQFEFRNGGRWVLIMHGPNGANYHNDSVFEEIQPNEKIVINHLSQPHFTLTITFEPRDGGTHIVWAQDFESSEIAAKVRLLNANEDNLDRLQIVLSGGTPSTGLTQNDSA
jgi:uncharacterized protein YndB with AHSA1/START domain